MCNRFRVLSLGVVVSLLLCGVALAGNYSGSAAASGNFEQFPILPLDSGGPDAYGYYFIDSGDSAFNAPEYNWIEISGYGTAIPFVADDENLGPFWIGFTFNFYGVDFLTFRACTNGWASFSSTGNSWTNAAIPTATEPNNLLAVFWDDLDFALGGDAFYYSNNVDTLIIEWQDVPFHIGGGIASCEAIITADGNILFQYDTITGANDSHTIGIENQPGTIGLQYIYNTARDESGQAILFTRTAPDYGIKNVLVLAADEASEYIASLTPYADIGTVDYFDGRTGTPTLGNLQSYDCVVVWTNYRFQDSIATGNVLADYLDAGGGVVLQDFCFFRGYGLAGRIMSQYSPYQKGTSFQPRTLGTNDTGHPLMAGVTALVDSYAVNVTLINSPILVASYGDGTPLVAYNPANKLVAINAYYGNNQQNGGNFMELSHNAIIFATNRPTDILFIISDAEGSSEAQRDLLEYWDIQGIDVYNGRIGTPSLTFLQQYDAAVVWSNYAFSDPTMMGNRLADYLDSGGGVVLLQFCFAINWELQGRIMSSYCPYAAGANRHATRIMGWYMPGHFLMTGVNAISDYFTANVTIQNGGVTVASWDDSSPFVAYNPNNHMVAINGYIGGAQQFTGDMMILVHNAINYSRGTTGVDDDDILPGKFELAQNYPNPFNPTTTIAFDIPRASRVTLEIFNVLGQRVTVLNDGELEAGHHTISFDASELGSGVYFYRLTAGENARTKKMVILK
ncbi:MAG: hypothetical protein A2W25_14155 [candidate division Zixibacteria bacterium RBG_16_53_22]|nr:MAG: hypothetical protein A2W25_14155 [candidate division Zixibacteria bacterium RBG_16_53_22]